MEYLKIINMWGFIIGYICFFFITYIIIKVLRNKGKEKANEWVDVLLTILGSIFWPLSLIGIIIGIIIMFIEEKLNRPPPKWL